MTDFKWNEDIDNVVFKSVQGVAVYSNPDGDIVIRQQAGPLDDDDQIVIVHSDRVEALIFAIKSEAGIL